MRKTIISTISSFGGDPRWTDRTDITLNIPPLPWGDTSSSAVTERLQDALCPSVVSFNSVIPRAVFYLILHPLICRVLLLLLLRNASDLRNCTSYFGACMWVWYCRPPISAHFHPTPQPPPVPQQLGEKDGSPLRGVARLCKGPATAVRRSHSSCYCYLGFRFITAYN